MKKEYSKLEMETIRFNAEDVITASGDECIAYFEDNCPDDCHPMDEY